MNGTLNFIRGLVRPVAVFGLMVGWIVGALSPLFGSDIEDAKFAVAALGPMAALTFKAWFDSRESK